IGCQGIVSDGFFDHAHTQCAGAGDCWANGCAGSNVCVKLTNTNGCVAPCPGCAGACINAMAPDGTNRQVCKQCVPSCMSGVACSEDTGSSSLYDQATVHCGSTDCATNGCPSGQVCAQSVNGFKQCIEALDPVNCGDASSGVGVSVSGWINGNPNSV